MKNYVVYDKLTREVVAYIPADKNLPIVMRNDVGVEVYDADTEPPYNERNGIVCLNNRKLNSKGA